MKTLAFALVPCVLLTSMSCKAPSASVLATCEPISLQQLQYVSTVNVIGNFPPGSPRWTDDPHLVKPLVTALEHGMVEDPVAEARIRMDKPYNGVIRLQSPRIGETEQIVRFDAAELCYPRYRREFVDAVTAAYRGGKDVVAFANEEGGRKSSDRKKSSEP